jgi:hypothetical protein
VVTKTPRMGAAAIMRAVLSADALDIPAEPSRRGDALWQSGELEYRVWLEATPDGNVRCDINVGDAKLSEAMAKYGNMAVMLRSLSTPRPWPAGKRLSEEDLGWLVGEFSAQIGFVKDRADLCDVLATNGDLVRGPVFAWLPVASYPARLVQALILARDLGSDQAEQSILEKLRSDPVPLSSGDKIEIMKAARGWAKQYSKALGFAVPP